MPIIKKVIFAPLFLISLATTIYFYKLILDKYLDVYFLAYGGLYQFALMAIPLILSSLFFCLYLTFTQNIKFAIPLALAASFTPFIFLSPNLSLVLGVCIFLSLLTAHFTLQNNFKTYVNFQPQILLTPPIKTLNMLLLLSLTFSYFLNANSIIQKEGFKIPDSLLEWSINMSMSAQSMSFKGEKYYVAQLPTITQEQIDLLKANPEVLKQYGITSEDLDSISPASQKAKNTPAKKTETTLPSIPGVDLKQTLKNQIGSSLEQMIKPYLYAIPVLLAIMFYSFSSLILWIASILLSPVISLIFLVLDKSGFVKYEKEMREVKKIVV